MDRYRNRSGADPAVLYVLLCPKVVFQAPTREGQEEGKGPQGICQGRRPPSHHNEGESEHATGKENVS